MSHASHYATCKYEESGDFTLNHTTNGAMQIALRICLQMQIRTQIMEANGHVLYKYNPQYLGGGRGNLFPYVSVVTYLAANGCSVTSTKVSTGIAWELGLLDKKREGRAMLEGTYHSRNLSRSDPSGEVLGLQCCWRSS